MATTSRAATPAATDYFSARSRSASRQSVASELSVHLDTIPDDAVRPIGVSNNIKREFKDKRIYVNPKTGLPVRPPTSFGLFKHAMKRKLKNTKMTFQEFNKKTNEKWARMSDEDKEPFIARARQLADQFKKIEVFYLRKKLRQLQAQVKDYRRAEREYYY